MSFDVSNDEWRSLQRLRWKVDNAMRRAMEERAIEALQLSSQTDDGCGGGGSAGPKLSFAEEIERQKNATKVEETPLERSTRIMDERAKEKSRDKRKLDKREAIAKKARGMLDLKSLFGENSQQMVHDRVSGKLRLVKNIVRPVPPPPLEPVAVAEPAAPVLAKYGKGVVPEDENDRLMRMEDCAGDALLLLAFKKLTVAPVYGCANQPECNAEVCEHESDVGVAPLEDVWARSRPTQRTKRVVTSYVPLNPFISLQFPLSEHVTKIDNTLYPDDELLNQPVRNDDFVLERVMSSQSPSIADRILRHRRVYHSELASLRAYRENMITRHRENASALINKAVARGDEHTKAELEREYAVCLSTLMHQFENGVSALNANFHEYVAREYQYTCDTQHYELPYTGTVNALLDIVRLSDGRHRPDSFYRALVEEVTCGRCDNLFAEVQREKREIAVRNHNEQLAAMALTLTSESQALLSAEFQQRASKKRMRTVNEIYADAAEATAMESAAYNDNGPIAIVSVDKSREIVSRDEQIRRATAGAVPRKPLHSYGDWRLMSDWYESVCESQSEVQDGGTACTAIAFLCALKFAVAAEIRAGMNETITMHEYVQYHIDYKLQVTRGATIWGAWHEMKENEAVQKGGGGDGYVPMFMMSNEVYEAGRSNFEPLFAKRQLQSREMAGPWLENILDTADTELSANNKPIDQWLAEVEQSAVGGQFGAVFTIRSTSIALGRVGDSYYVFDSHAASGEKRQATLLRFPKRSVLCDALRTRFFMNTSPDDVRELSKSDGTMHVISERYTYHLHAIFKTGHAADA